MTTVDIMERIREVGLVPVVRAASADEAFAAVEAIRAGGIPILEITLTVPGAVQIIAELTKRLGDEALIGAGTVLDADTAQECVDAGAKFIVSPALDIPTIQLCRRLVVPIFAGALTPTEIVTAWKAGANAVKIFPANAVGGATYLKSLKAPLPQIEFLPTGGVSLKTAADFIAAGAFALGVGADLVDLAALRRGDAASITEKARQYVAAVAAAR
ncbi:MAG TPA: bifunctional 4-hydroxy-2-oxoglutarate aldolase/2-dehydro-3-deoxy-phosphogluconate aldolase [Thermoanaerobaculia bacterium]|jgi:2-dehydro-3-deoxyphosphogluconate aldolase/(4S)-4-hydroxy-2-oxoglutarate aldolase|nr:bifunctional 4-hydroxy-2-oxoglutarate aldolase/2-dehydro-3-deoxy-phosphogluconate aldolase [Thermoanaerobaculia bacterium]